MLGISEEQHGDRTRLFMQWQEMDWPVLIDSLNLLEVKAVPITLLIDQWGIIRYSRPTDRDLTTFLETDYSQNPESAQAKWSDALTTAVSAVHTSEVSLGAAIEAQPAPETRTPRQWFHAGVIYRKRYDSDNREPGDFAKAVESWNRALSGDPSQYIWRRRIQQYGPRLDKPYPFYDWVPKAREQILERGDTPAELTVEPSGAEFAAPVRSDGNIDKAAEALQFPDPQGQLPVDEHDFVRIASVVVPSTADDKPALRIHLTLTPNDEKDVHWNNESGFMTIWWLGAEGERTGSIIPVPESVAANAVSEEIRRFEFEVQPPADTREITGEVFTYVCEGRTATCQFLRKPFTIPLPPSP